MTRVQHATTAPISCLDWVPFLGAARVRLERMVLNLTDPPGRARHINYLEPAGNPGIFGPDSVSSRVLNSSVTVFIGVVACLVSSLHAPQISSAVADEASKLAGSGALAN